MSANLAMPSFPLPLRILVAGESVLDRYVWGTVERVSPEAPIPVLRVQRREERLGNAAFVCANLSSLGAKPALLSLIGEDPNGMLITQLLAALGVDISSVVRDPGRPTIVKERMLGWVMSAQRATQQLLRVDSEDVRPIEPEIEARLLELLETKIAAMDGALVSDLNKGVLTPKLLRVLIEGGRRASKPVIVDPRLSADFSIYRGATALTPNRFEAQRATGLDLSLADNWPRAAAHLIEQLDLDCCLITLDRDGMYLGLRQGGGGHIPTQPRDVYDVVGAGDVVLTTFGLLLAGGADGPTAARIANAAAGVQVSRQGASIISRQDIDCALRYSHRSSENKIVGLQELAVRLEQNRGEGRRICYTNGCFDLFRAGYVHLLEFARSQGDLLVVGLASDSGARRPQRIGQPIYSQEDRTRIVAALAAVDYVTVVDFTQADQAIRLIRPDVLIEGEDYQGNLLADARFVESYGGRVVLAPRLDKRASASTSWCG
ncbi:MAG TPA: PfkB family carbohydrate kinase [Candidatus Binataceae bacterium]|nr:PfkB family carbohydrate kinase [Candidatus Binataceae bacterium]